MTASTSSKKYNQRPAFEDFGQGFKHFCLGVLDTLQMRLSASVRIGGWDDSAITAF
jgi:hypothetical protein